MELKKFDADKQIVYGEVYAPTGVPDSQGDFMTAESIEKMAHKFLTAMRVDQIDTNHDHVLTGANVVESFIARKGDPDFIEGAWVVGVHVPDPEVWASIRKGDLNGFSMEAQVLSRSVAFEMEVPEYVLGETTKAEGHMHPFKVFFDHDGNFEGGIALKGETDHEHPILNGTTTESILKHMHRFSFVELLVDPEAMS